jgi:hypothetical protein
MGVLQQTMGRIGNSVITRLLVIAGLVLARLIPLEMIKGVIPHEPPPFSPQNRSSMHPCRSRSMPPYFSKCRQQPSGLCITFLPFCRHDPWLLFVIYLLTGTKRVPILYV